MHIWPNQDFNQRNTILVKSRSIGFRNRRNQMVSLSPASEQGKAISGPSHNSTKHSRVVNSLCTDFKKEASTRMVKRRKKPLLTSFCTYFLVFCSCKKWSTSCFPFPASGTTWRGWEHAAGWTTPPGTAAQLLRSSLSSHLEGKQQLCGCIVGDLARHLLPPNSPWWLCVSQKRTCQMYSLSVGPADKED